MYQDNGEINVELLAEVGGIAHRLRTLNTRLALSLDDPRYQQELQNNPAAAHCSNEPKSEAKCSERRHSSAAQIAQDIGDRIIGSAGTSVSVTSHQRRYSSKQIEDIILEFYEKHLIYHQNKEKERLANSIADASEPKRSRIYRLTNDNSNNMSDLPSSKTSSKCSSSNFGENTNRNFSEDISIEQTTTATSSTSLSSPSRAAAANAAAAAAASSSPSLSSTTNITTTTTTKLPELTIEPSEQTSSSGKRNSIANQQMPEIQISNSDEQPKTRKSLTDNFETKEPTAESSEERASSSIHETTGGICSHYCAGWQTSTIWSNQLDEDVLRTLIMELKHKIEFTERMNWLCKYNGKYDSSSIFS